MEPSRESEDTDDMRPEYDFSQMTGWVRGKYFDRKRVEQLASWYEQTANFLADRPNIEPTPELREFLARVDKEMEPLLSGSVLPVVVMANGRTGLIGTGTLFRVADVSFLVTASHVLAKAKKLGGDLYIFDHPGHGGGIQLHGETDLYPELDVTVWRLPEDVVAAMPNRKFLTVHHADRDNRRPRKGIYLIHGYPECWYSADTEQKELTFRSFTAVCGEYSGDTKDLHKASPYDPDFHILLGTPRDGAFPVTGPDAATPDHFHGMSGCSIWQVIYEGLYPRLWTPDDAAVVAVQTGVYNGTITKGTRWWVVDEIIRRDYPELAGSLAITTP
jgi:hypothetical protein